MSRLQEHTILSSLPSHIHFVARDENGELWAVKDEPKIEEGSNGKMLIFGNLNETDQDNIYSLAMFNHMFREIKDLDILGIDEE